MDDMEMNELDEQERGEQERSEQEEETNFDDDGRHGDENILIIDGSNPIFNRLDDEEDADLDIKSRVKKMGKSDGKVKRYIIHTKKQFIKNGLGATINMGDGPSSTTLYDELRITTSKKSGKINGALYKGKKILIMKNGKMERSTAARNERYVNEFEELLKKAHAEHQKTPAAQVEGHQETQGLDAADETVDSVLEEISEAIGERISESGDEVLNNPDITANERREMEKLFSSDEYRELSGVAHEGLPKLTSDKETDKKLIDGKLKSYKKDAEHWRTLAEKEEEAGARRRALELAGQASELLDDRLRLLTGQRVQSKEALEIMEKVIEVNDLTRFERFRKWARENLLELSAVSIYVAGILTTVIMAGRSALKRGSQAVSKFGKAIANLAKKFGPILSAIGTLVSKVRMLTFGAHGILFLAQNLWILVLALTYFIYNEYMSRRRK
jgi:hypothetical protein